MKLELGEPPEDSENILEAFRDALLISGASDSTIKLYVTAVKEFLEFIKKDPRKVTSEDVNKWVASLMRKELKFKKRVDENEARRARSITIRYYVIAVRRFLKWIGVNVKPIVPKVRNKEPKILKEEDVEALLKVVKGIENKLIVSLFLDTGLRAKELLSIKLGDIDLERNSIHITNAKNDEERVVFFTDRTKKLLINYISRQGIKDPEQPLFNLTYQALYRRIKRLGKKLGLDLRPHLLRHTFATLAIKKGLPVPAVQRILGHRDIKTTQIYTHLVSEDLEKLYKKTFEESSSGSAKKSPL
ncbi:MAG: tyrosine-type recombinase/integrase [Sulfolobaceae archaeon]|nr:tyrosine-type recombinase/integrase [Sulfolobaceae archaeon]